MSLIDSIRDKLRRRRHRRDARANRILERIAQVERLLNEQILQSTVRDALARNPLHLAAGADDRDVEEVVEDEPGGGGGVFDGAFELE